jgi:triosephosphate isomerase (TIM)
MSSKVMVVGNWKMHLNASQSSLLAHRLHQTIKLHKDVEVVLAPSMLALQPLSLQLDRRKFKLAAQDAYYRDDGAYTGAVSFTMLRDLVNYVIVGHSERRYKFGETLDQITAKVEAAYRNGIVPILCIGETTTERLNGETNQVLHDQLSTAVANITSAEVEHLVLAYEPVWSVGNGDYAKPDLVAQAIKFIRADLTALYGEKAAKSVRILYGGSVNPDVAGGYLRVKGISGLLVGEASLNYQQFSAIVDTAYRRIHRLRLRGDDD